MLLLVVEDEPLILLNIKDALEESGFTVLSAEGGSEAMDAVADHIDELSGMILDVRLGAGPNGWEVARHARGLKSDMPIVYTTGDSAADWPAHGVPKSLVVQKPYVPAQVITAISTLLTEVDTNSAGLSS